MFTGPHTQKTIERIAAARRAVMAIPAQRAKIAAKQTLTGNDPDERQRRRLRMQAQWADPVRRERLLQGKGLGGLSEQQRADYRVLRRKGYSKPDALAFLAVDARAAA